MSSSSSFPSVPALFVLGSFLALVPSSIATSEVVSRVCSRATDYKYCVEAIYSDPRAQNADRSVLADISFRMAYANASHTLDYVSRLLNTGWSNDTGLVGGLKVCHDVYRKGVDAMASAMNDLSSETYYYLGQYADTASRGAKKCSAASGGNRPPAGLESRNRDMKGLSEICSLVSDLFVSSD